MIYPPPGEEPRDLLAQLRIRHALESDLPALEWDGEYTHFRRVYESSFSRQKQGKGVMWLVELPGVGIIGQVFLQFITDPPRPGESKPRAYLYSFRVKPLYRSLGIGARLLNTAISDLRRRGFRQITLNVAQNNPRAIEFYKGHGFHIIGEDSGEWSYPDHHGVWRDVCEPAFRMLKAI